MNKRTLTIILIPIGIVVAGVLVMNMLLGMKENPPRRAPEPRARIVDARVVELGTVAADIIAYGTVTTAQPVEVYAEVAGLLGPGDVPFQPAQTFRRGDILLRVDDREVQLERRSAISELLNALANVLPEIKVDFPDEFGAWQAYFESVRFDGPVPDLPETDNQKIKLFLSRFNVYRLYFQVKNLEIRLEKHEIRAPFDGAIVRADLRAGSTTRTNSLLGTIINLDDLEVEVPVPAADIDWIDHDRDVTFTSEELVGEWEGRIARVGSAIDARTQTVPMYIRLDGNSRESLLEGVFFEADLPGRAVENAIEIPRRAIYEQRFVYLVTNGQLEYREVSVAREQRTTVIVDGGLVNGDTLIVEPLQGVAPGMLAQARVISASERSL
jgi:multidrug efflux pump subunit AcrA (membrane-fusion protein)